MTDTSQTIVWRWDRDAFGLASPDEDPDGTAPADRLDLRFPGQILDEMSGLYYNYYRDYDPVSGRYLQSDPIGLGGGLNTFAYVEGNPISNIDPAGLSTITIPIGAGMGGIARPVPMSTVDPIVFPDIPGMPGGINRDPHGEYCQSLAKKIANTRNEIYNKRLPELQSNPNGLPQRIGPGEKPGETVRGHEKLLNRRLGELKKLENEYARNCVPVACLN